MPDDKLKEQQKPSQGKQPHIKVETVGPRSKRLKPKVSPRRLGRKFAVKK